jgi:hypothetical protein
MVMVCPQCSTAHEQSLQCPVCSGRLVFAESERARSAPLTPRLRRPSPWGRILIGLLLSQGLFYALRQLLTGILMAWKDEEQTLALWASPAGFFLIQGMQLIALVLSGMLTGSGHANGPALGGIVGVWSGVFSILLQRGPAQHLTALALYGQPLVQAFFGAIGGWLGALVWKPIPTGQSGPVRQEIPPARRNRPRWWKSHVEGRIAWFRVAAGTALALAGTLTATALFDLLLDVSNGQLGTSDGMQDLLFTGKSRRSPSSLAALWPAPRPPTASSRG